MEATGKAHDVIDRAASAARPAVERIASGAHQAVDKLASAAGQAAEALGVKGGQLKDVQARAMEQCRAYVAEHPLTSIGIAMAAGFLLSRLLRSRQST